MNKLLFLCLAVWAVCSQSNAQSIQPGLDPTFGKKGIVIDTHENFFQACDLALQPDGKIIVAGADYIARYLSDGMPDSSFGHIGLVPVTTLTDSLGGYGASVLLQADGKIVMSGHTSVGAYVLRLKQSGSLDSSFGINGKTHFCCGAEHSALQADGKILVAGSMDDSYFVIHRFTASGKVDSSFAGSGFVKRNTGSYKCDVEGIGVLSDGRIATGGRSANSTVICLRYMPDGGQDSSLAGTGITAPTGAIYCRDFKVSPDGKMLFAKGGFNRVEDAEIGKLKIDGTFDSTFGQNGILKVLGLAVEYLLQMSDGRILCGGNDDTDFVITRLKKDGISVDSGFGKKGFINTDVAGWYYERAIVLALQPDGKIIAAGVSQENHPGIFDPVRASMVRYNADAYVRVPHVSGAVIGQLRLFPNPAHTTLHVVGPSSGKGVTQLFATDGRLMMEAEYTNGQSSFNISALPGGSYMVNLKTVERDLSGLFLKE